MPFINVTSIVVYSVSHLNQVTNVSGYHDNSMSVAKWWGGFVCDTVFRFWMF